MTQEEYSQAQRECWEEFLQKHEISRADGVTADAFIMAFDRAYALGKQEKDAKPNKTIKARRKSDGEIIEVKEWRGVSDVIYSSPDMNQFYQTSELDFNIDAEATVIQGWVARDADGNAFMYCTKPERDENLQAWIGRYADFDLRNSLFPDITWDSAPIEVEQIIKRKNNG